jgi:hypothetical protein
MSEPATSDDETLGFLQGVRQVVHILRHIDDDNDLNMLGRLIPYGGGGEVPLDRLAELAARMTREQFGDLMRLQSRPDTDDEQSQRDRKLVAEHLCEELACSGVSFFFFFFFFFFPLFLNFFFFFFGCL